MYEILNIANFHAFHVWVKCILSCNDTTFFFHFFPCIAFVTQLFSTLVMSPNLRNQALLFNLQSSAFCRAPHLSLKKSKEKKQRKLAK